MSVEELVPPNVRTQLVGPPSQKVAVTLTALKRAMNAQADVFEARIRRHAQRYVNIREFSNDEHYILGFLDALPLSLRPKLMSLLELGARHAIDQRMLVRAVVGLKRAAQDELDAQDNNPDPLPAA